MSGGGSGGGGSTQGLAGRAIAGSLAAPALTLLRARPAPCAAAEVVAHSNALLLRAGPALPLTAACLANCATACASRLRAAAIHAVGSRVGWGLRSGGARWRAIAAANVGCVGACRPCIAHFGLPITCSDRSEEAEAAAVVLVLSSRTIVTRSNCPPPVWRLSPGTLPAASR